MATCAAYGCQSPGAALDKCWPNLSDAEQSVSFCAHDGQDGGAGEVAISMCDDDVGPNGETEGIAERDVDINGVNINVRVVDVVDWPLLLIQHDEPQARKRDGRIGSWSRRNGYAEDNQVNKGGAAMTLGSGGCAMAERVGSHCVGRNHAGQDIGGLDCRVGMDVGVGGCVSTGHGIGERTRADKRPKVHRSSGSADSLYL